MIKDNSLLLGKSFSCECGKEHTVPTKYFFYGENCYESLKKVITETTSGSRVTLVADSRTYNACGERVRSELQDFNVTTYVVKDGDEGEPAANDLTKDTILEETPETDFFVAVGSGVINDLVKWVSFLRKTPYLVVPTAASMNGYGSANVAATIDGLKMLFHAEACKSVHTDPQVLIDAPFELTTSGLGDVLAKSVSSADWRLNQHLFDEYYCQFSVDLLKELEPVYLNNPQGIHNKERKAIKALFDALFYSSIAMTITGTSSPASGGEHLVSHTLDMLANRDGKKHDLHGRQVGVASILMAALYERVMAIETPVFHQIPQNIDTEFWGSLSDVVEKEYKKKKVKFEKASKYLTNPQNWLDLKKSIVPSLVSPSRLKNCLQQAGGAHRYDDIRVDGVALDRDKFTRVVLNANQMRERFTILDLATLLGVLPNEIDELVKKWLSPDLQSA